jgi:hypothetical protein
MLASKHDPNHSMAEANNWEHTRSWSQAGMEPSLTCRSCSCRKLIPFYRISAEVSHGRSLPSTMLLTER